MANLKGRVLAIDPGSEFSAYVVIDTKTYEPLTIGKVHNTDLLEFIDEYINAINSSKYQIDTVIEMVASYGMAVGQTVFDTCVWVGRFVEANDWEVDLMYRKDVKKAFNKDLPKGEKVTNDSSIINYLANRFAPNEPNRGKGKKDSPSWFYGFKADIWQAYAVGVAYIDGIKE